MASLKIHYLGERKIEITLNEGKAVLDTVNFEFDKNLDTLLIESVDKVLKRNKIDITSLKNIGLVGDIDKNSSLYKIVESFKSAVDNLK
jgi:hypothetical protein